MSKVDKDFGDNLAELLGALSKEMKENPIKIESEFEYPMEISGIKLNHLKNVNTKKTGMLVQIRPCDEEYKKKTYLGIYLGKFPIEIVVSLSKNTNVLNVMNMTNPAIFVPELKKVIFGCESWWGEIESEAELKEITNDDIENVWYIKALKQIGQIKEEKNQTDE